MKAGALLTVLVLLVVSPAAAAPPKSPPPSEPQQQQQPDPAITQLSQSLEQLTLQVRRQGDALEGLTKRLDAMSDDLKALKEKPAGPSWVVLGLVGLALLLSLGASVFLSYLLVRRVRREIYRGTADVMHSIRVSGMETRTRIDRVGSTLDELWRRLGEAMSVPSEQAAFDLPPQATTPAPMTPPPNVERAVTESYNGSIRTQDARAHFIRQHGVQPMERLATAANEQPTLRDNGGDPAQATYWNVATANYQLIFPSSATFNRIPELSADEGRTAKEQFNGIFKIEDSETFAVLQPALGVNRHEDVLVVQPGVIRMPLRR
jgi:hypothetical protein